MLVEVTLMNGQVFEVETSEVFEVLTERNCATEQLWQAFFVQHPHAEFIPFVKIVNVEVVM